jgi:transitional endoplasmic reticulum ATPase
MSVHWRRNLRNLKARNRYEPRPEDGPSAADTQDADASSMERLDAQMPLEPDQETSRALWMLRLLRELPKLSVTRGPLADDDVLQELGLDSDVLEKLSREVAQDWLASRLARLEQREIALDSIGQNTRWLAGWLGLGEAERRLLELAATVPVSEALRRCMNPFARLSTPRAMALLAKVLGVPVDDVRAGLSPRSPLVSAGLIEFKPARDGHHQEWLVVKDPFDDVLAAHHEQPDELFSAICPRASEPELALDAFSHLSREVELLSALLRGASRERARGINVLLFGPPGSGKSQLVRTVAQALGLPLRQVPDAGPSGDELKGEKRLATLGTLQYLLQGSPGLVVFDEIEDAFPWAVEGGWLRQRSGSDKARTNRLLEENSVPCVWVGNRVRQLDPAFVRRFSLVLELPAPPRRVRETLLEAYASGLDVPSELQRELAEDPVLMPADVARAARVTRLVQRGCAAEPATAAEATDEAGVSPSVSVSPSPVLSDAHVFERALFGARPSKPERSRAAELDYDPKLVNTSVPLERLTRGLKQRPRGCVCLYGPPGTGKTAFARQLASALERPLMTRSAGDLLDMYVGGTEQAIKSMFEEATRSDCVLLLDEADGLMRNRAGAVQGFEVTQVNELLVRMESFRGIFLCATNGFEALDPASLRRFSLRIEFLPLDAEQNFTLWQRTASKLGLEPDPAAERHARRRLASLTLLTPGDHAAVLRGRLLLGDASVDGLLGDLERAQAEKRSQRRIGFVA